MSQKSVLVIDDEPQILSLFAEALDRHGYRTAVAEDGEAALKVLKDMQPDVIFLDLKLPGEDGVQVLERIRDTHPTVPVVIITAYARDMLVDKAMRLGAFACLIKPFSMSSVLGILAALELGEAA